MNKTVLITGTSSGFGKTAAKYFAARDWNVVATMRRPTAERDLVRLDNVLVTRLDVQDAASIAPAIEAGVARFGGIDVLINNAGFGLFGIFEATPPAKVREQFDVNVFGVMEVTRAILPHFRARKSGIILNVTSGAGVFGLPTASLYTATKFAIEGFSEAIAWELASQNIIVKIIEPGGVLSTKTGERSGAELAAATSIPDYDAFLTHADATFAELRANVSATEEDVARVMFEAATDGTNQLRYVATDDIKPLVHARRETSEAAYMALMRERFAFTADGASASRPDERGGFPPDALRKIPSSAG